MPKGKYRLEGVRRKETMAYYLVRDVKTKGRRGKVRKYVSSGDAPSKKELDEFQKKHSYELELKAVEKKSELSSSTFGTKYLPPEKIKELEKLRHLYLAFTSLSTKTEAETYEQDFEIHYIGGTTSIEGNTLSLNETRDLLLNKILPKDKTLREINEVQNFRNVITYRNKFKGHVNLDFFRNLHAHVMNNIDHESAGSFRRADSVSISGRDLQVTPTSEIEAELQELIDEYYLGVKEGFHPFEQAVLFHYGFEMIHPFQDGNGRVGREIFNYLLKRAGFPKMLFLGRDRPRYILALKFGNEGRNAEMVSTFCHLILDRQMRALDEYLKVVSSPIKKKGQTRLMDFIEEQASGL